MHRIVSSSPIGDSVAISDAEDAPSTRDNTNPSSGPYGGAVVEPAHELEEDVLGRDVLAQ
jgi:hypothetical protein